MRTRLPGRTHRSRRRAVGWLTLVVVLAATGCGSSPADGPKSPVDGPVQFAGREVEQRAGLYADPGSSVVFGAAVVRNHGTEPVELVEADLVGDVRSAEAAVVEVRVLDLESGNRDLVGAAEWPFEDYAQRTQPLAGFTLDADAEAALLFVVDVHEEGSWVWPGTRLTYRVGGEELRADSSLGFHVCATTPRECASDRGL